MKSIITNLISGKTKFISVPTNAVNAQAFAENFLEGDYAVYAQSSVVGTDTVTVAPVIFDVYFKNIESDDKGYLTLWVPHNKTENDVITVLKGLSLNGVNNIDYVFCKQRVAEKF